MNVTGTEWARVAPGEVVIATPTRSWLHRPSNPADPFLFPMTAPGTVATTGRLLDGAIAAGLQADRAGTETPPPLTATRWIWRLISYYHLTTHTPGLMAEAARRFEAAALPVLAAWAADKAADEAHHDRLALRDLAELGYLPGIVAQVPPTAGRLVAWFRASVVGADVPWGVLAYAHTVERLALTLGTEAIAAVQAVLPPGSRAIRCLRVHSALGTDVAHVSDNVEVIAALPAGRRAAIALACREVAALFCAVPDEGYSNDARLEQGFRAWRATDGGLA